MSIIAIKFKAFKNAKDDTFELVNIIYLEKVTEKSRIRVQRWRSDTNKEQPPSSLGAELLFTGGGSGSGLPIYSDTGLENIISGIFYALTAVSQGHQKCSGHVCSTTMSSNFYCNYHVCSSR